jgi:hypothetical protein
MQRKPDTVPMQTGKKRKVSAQQMTTLFLLLMAVLFIVFYLAHFGTARAQASDDLKKFLDTYFSTWSAQDMKGYQSHFHANAQVIYVQEGRVTSALGREAFIEQQTLCHQSANVRMTEKMTSCDVLEDEKAASVSARWELKKGDKAVTGTDRYTVIRDPAGEWKIVSLVFYEDKAE